MSDLEQRLVDALLAEVKGEPAPLALAFARGVARTVEPVLAAEVAALREKAAAADRVEALADGWTRLRPKDRTKHPIAAAINDCGDDLLAALTGPVQE